MGNKLKLNHKQMVESNNRTYSLVTQKSNTSVYGEQPVSLIVNWMKHDVTKCDPEALRRSIPTESKKELSPLRQKLKQKGEEITKKRQLLTLTEIEAKIDEARLRKDYAKADALSAQVLARMNRALESKIKHAYLLEKANIRHQTEEVKEQNLETQKTSLKKRQQQVQIRRVKADERESSVSSSSAQGLEGLN